MSERYPGGFISKTAPTVTTSSAQGVWTMEQQAAYQKAGTWPQVPTYIEDVFSTYLYKGTGIGSLSINNGIDLTVKGGMTWVKQRTDSLGGLIFDTNRGNNNLLAPWATIAQQDLPTWSPSTNETFTFGSSGFTVSKGSNTYPGGYVDGATNENLVSWTFRKQAKFFDVVTWTGNGGSNRAISHSLGSVPGCYIIKATSTASDWYVYHRGADGSGGGAYINQSGILNSTAAFAGSASDGLMPSSTAIYVVDSGSTTTSTNSNGVTYVAYIFAHNAGGFGLTGTDNVISCGSYTGDGTTNYSKTISLGYEPQWIMVKRSSTTGSWFMLDTMRGWNMSDLDMYLAANLSNAETDTSMAQPNATGFAVGGTTNLNASGSTYIYIAIRRGPMKTPTSGTSVYTTDTRNAGSVGPRYTSGFPVDMSLRVADVNSASHNTQVWDRLRGDLQNLNTNTTDSETTLASTLAPNFGFNTGIATLSSATSSSSDDRAWMFRRAPSFMDVVCYSGNSAQTAYNHNLGAAPELVIVKIRNLSGESWPVWCVHGTQQNSWAAILNGTSAYANRGQNMWGTSPTGVPSMTATTFRLGDNTNVNETGYNYVAYLFASCPGVSKVGTYTGNGSSQTINCGFTGGVRFLIIKNASSGGTDWQMWDTGRGITAGNDPVLYLNSTAAQVNADFISQASNGFTLNNGDSQYNANGNTYIYLAIA